MTARRSIEEIAQASGWTGGIRRGRDWAEVEQAVGIRFPDDCKDLMTRFPSGCFRGAVNFDNPIDARVDLAKFVRDEIHSVLESFSGSRSGKLEGTDYRLFPEPGGLLPWANDTGGGVFFWRTSPEDPNHWPVVFWDRGMSEWNEHPGGMVEVIWEVLNHTGANNILRMDLDYEEPNFRVPSTHLGDGKWLPHKEYR
ncbi:SMI1/KNR4 family protein [Amycolatopsis circi]|uniref:SMI1/KNR4 family protein n=1 Tax=Amycolatopsis circi TaxID=871959 RepID=UPI0013BE8B66|nr:SMI1/KNR4 family protein [Amycolatopsis circi]